MTRLRCLLGSCLHPHIQRRHHTSSGHPANQASQAVGRLSPDLQGPSHTLFHCPPANNSLDASKVVRQRTAEVPPGLALRRPPALTPASPQSCYAPAYPGIFSRSVHDPDSGQQQQRIRVELAPVSTINTDASPAPKVPACLPRSLHLSTSLWK